MKTFTHIVSLILIALLCTSGLPLFSPEDASRDGRVDLRDAVMLVQDLAVEPEASTSFFRGFTDLLHAVRIVAGLRSEITPRNEPASSPTTLVLVERHDQSLLQGFLDFASIRGAALLFPEPAHAVQDIDAAPALPPPERIMV